MMSTQVALNQFPFPEPPERGVVPAHDADYVRPPAPIAPFSFQHREAYELVLGFDRMQEVAEVVIDARETIESAAAGMPRAMTEVHDRARVQLVAAIKTALDPREKGSVSQSIYALTHVLKEQARTAIETKADEQVGRLVGLEDRVARETKKSLESITAATAALQGMAESIARQRAELKQAEARIAAARKPGWLRRLAGWF